MYGVFMLIFSEIDHCSLDEIKEPALFLVAQSSAILNMKH